MASSAVVFGAVYLLLSFAIPGLRIKLAAEPALYFVRSLCHMAAFKSGISLAAAGLTAILLRHTDRKV